MQANEVKVGSKYTLKKQHGILPKDTICTIISGQKNRDLVWFVANKNGTDYGVGAMSMDNFEEYFEPYVDPKENKPKDIAVGDYVAMIVDAGFTNYGVGSVFRVEEIKFDSFLQKYVLRLSANKVQYEINAERFQKYFVKIHFDNNKNDTTIKPEKPNSNVNVNVNVSAYMNKDNANVNKADNKNIAKDILFGDDDACDMVDIMDVIDRMDEGRIIVKTVFGKCTIVALQLTNGYVLVESSTCISPKNYDVNVGIENCMKKIMQRVYALEAYMLSDDIAIDAEMDGKSVMSEEGEACHFHCEHDDDDSGDGCINCHKVCG